MTASYAGVENLQVYANNTGYAANFGLDTCAYCWVKGVESNYTDGDHVEVYWGYHDEIRDSYFSNAFVHAPGTYDSDVDLALKTSASLVENNIIERTHESIMLEWGSAGNVISYNYMKALRYRISKCSYWRHRLSWRPPSVQSPRRQCRDANIF